MGELKVKALWVGPFEAQVPDGTVLIPGETVYEVTAGEAEQSAYWQPLKAQRNEPKLGELREDT